MKKKKDCYWCKYGDVDAGGWVWCLHKKNKKAKHSRENVCGGCKYFNII